MPSSILLFRDISKHNRVPKIQSEELYNNSFLNWMANKIHQYIGQE